MSKDLFNQALQIACQAHFGQFDKSGTSYILHPLSVMNLLESDDEELRIIALLHDVVEDSEFTLSDLELIFPKRITVAVDILTKKKGQHNQEYLDLICSNKDASLVKIADLRHNSDLTRLKGVTKKDLERMEKYHHMYLKIKSTLNN